MKEEQESLRKLLTGLEKECGTLRKQLDKEHKIQSQMSHSQIQEAHSRRHLNMAKYSSFDKLVTQLDTKEKN